MNLAIVLVHSYGWMSLGGALSPIQNFKCFMHRVPWLGINDYAKDLLIKALHLVIHFDNNFRHLFIWTEIVAGWMTACNSFSKVEPFVLPFKALFLKNFALYVDRIKQCNANLVGLCILILWLINHHVRSLSQLLGLVPAWCTFIFLFNTCPENKGDYECKDNHEGDDTENQCKSAHFIVSIELQLAVCAAYMS